jgi:hypothetical protein
MHMSESSVARDRKWFGLLSVLTLQCPDFFYSQTVYRLPYFFLLEFLSDAQNTSGKTTGSNTEC